MIYVGPRTIHIKTYFYHPLSFGVISILEAHTKRIPWQYPNPKSASASQPQEAPLSTTENIKNMQAHKAG